MEFVTLDEHAARHATMSEVVTFVTADTQGAIAISSQAAAKFRAQLQVEAQLTETLRTGIGPKARGIKLK